MIKSMAHVAFSVSDLENSLDFYVNKLGFKKKFTLDNQDGSVWIVYLEVGENQFLELFPTSEKSFSKKSSYQHLCLEVENMKETVRRLEAAGIVLDQPIIKGLDNNWQCWIHDPDDNPIELMEYGPDSLQLRK